MLNYQRVLRCACKRVSRRALHPLQTIDWQRHVMATVVWMMRQDNLPQPQPQAFARKAARTHHKGRNSGASHPRPQCCKASSDCSKMCNQISNNWITICSETSALQLVYMCVRVRISELLSSFSILLQIPSKTVLCSIRSNCNTNPHHISGHPTIFPATFLRWSLPQMPGFPSPSPPLTARSFSRRHWCRSDGAGSGGGCGGALAGRGQGGDDARLAWSRQTLASTKRWFNYAIEVLTNKNQDCIWFHHQKVGTQPHSDLSKTATVGRNIDLWWTYKGGLIKKWDSQD